MSLRLRRHYDQTKVFKVILKQKIYIESSRMRTRDPHQKGMETGRTATISRRLKVQFS